MTDFCVGDDAFDVAAFVLMNRSASICPVATGAVVAAAAVVVAFAAFVAVAAVVANAAIAAVAAAAVVAATVAAVVAAALSRWMVTVLWIMLTEATKNDGQ